MYVGVVAVDLIRNLILWYKMAIARDTYQKLGPFSIDHRPQTEKQQIYIKRTIRLKHSLFIE